MFSSTLLKHVLLGVVLFTVFTLWSCGSSPAATTLSTHESVPTATHADTSQQTTPIPIRTPSPTSVPLLFSLTSTAVPLISPTPIPTATPVMYKLASNTYAPEGVWKSFLHRYPQVFLLVAAKVPNTEADIHAVLTVSAWCDSQARQLGILGVEVSRGAGVRGNKYWEVMIQLSGDEAYSTTWIDINPEVHSLANLWRLWGTVLGEKEWPAEYPTPQEEVPFWDSLLPGLYTGKDLHFTIGEKLTVSFDAHGFRAAWDSLTPACPLNQARAPATSPVPESHALTVEEYVDFCSANTSNNTTASVLGIDPNDYADVSTMTNGDMVRVLEAHLQIVKPVIPPPVLERYHIAQIGFFEGLIQYYGTFPPKNYIDWRTFERDLVEDADLSWKLLTLSTAIDNLPGDLGQRVLSHCSN